MNKVLYVVVVPVGILCAGGPVRAFPLVESGATSAKVFFKNDAPADVQDAAAELVRVIEKMSGARLVSQPVPDARAVAAGPGIVLGALAEEMGLRKEEHSRARDGFRCRVQGSKLLIVGESPTGVYTGAWAGEDSGWGQAYRIQFCRHRVVSCARLPPRQN